MTDEERVGHADLFAEYRAIKEEWKGKEVFTEEIDAHPGELEIEMEGRPLKLDAEEIGRAGTFVTLDRYGEHAVYRGFVRPEDEPREDADFNSSEHAEEGQRAELSMTRHMDYSLRQGGHFCRSGGWHERTLR